MFSKSAGLFIPFKHPFCIIAGCTQLATEDAVTSSGKFQFEIVQYAICMNVLMDLVNNKIPCKSYVTHLMCMTTCKHRTYKHIDVQYHACEHVLV